MQTYSSQKKHLIFLISLLMIISIAIPVSAQEKAFFAQKKYTIKTGQTISPLLVLHEGETVVKWKSSNKKIVKVFSSGLIKGKKTGRAKLTAITNLGRKAVCSIKVKKSTSKKSRSSGSTSDSSASTGTVYWVPNGAVYHFSISCPTLSRSKNIYSGTIAESGKSRACKVCG